VAAHVALEVAALKRDRELERVGVSGIWQLGRLAKAQGVDHVLARLLPALAAVPLLAKAAAHA